MNSRLKLIPRFVLILALAAALLGPSVGCRREADRARAAGQVGAESKSPARLENQITIRNLTSEWVTFTVTPFGSTQAPVLKTLKAGGLEKFEEREGLILTFWRGGEEKTSVLNAGMPYCFRYDENDRIQVYPGSHMREDAEDLAPYVPTPMEVVEKMLAMAKVVPADLVYDLGCGDGRIVILAARKYGARGVGVDIDPERIREARAAARRAGVERLVTFRVENAMQTDFSAATVLTLYLLPESNTLLLPRLEEMLRSGARVVSHNYSIRGWKAELLDSASIKDSQGVEHTIFLYKK